MTSRLDSRSQSSKSVNMKKKNTRKRANTQYFYHVFLNIFTTYLKKNNTHRIADIQYFLPRTEGVRSNIGCLKLGVLLEDSTKTINFLQDSGWIM